MRNNYSALRAIGMRHDLENHPNPVHQVLHFFAIGHCQMRPDRWASNLPCHACWDESVGPQHADYPAALVAYHCSMLHKSSKLFHGPC